LKGKSPRKQKKEERDNGFGKRGFGTKEKREKEEREEEASLRGSCIVNSHHKIPYHCTVGRDGWRGRGVKLTLGIA